MNPQNLPPSAVESGTPEAWMVECYDNDRWNVSGVYSRNPGPIEAEFRDSWRIVPLYRTPTPASGRADALEVAYREGYRDGRTDGDQQCHDGYCGDENSGWVGSKARAALHPNPEKPVAEPKNPGDWTGQCMENP